MEKEEKSYCPPQAKVITINVAGILCQSGDFSMGNPFGGFGEQEL